MKTMTYERPKPFAAALRVGGALMIGLSTLLVTWAAVRPAAAQAAPCLAAAEMRKTLGEKFNEKPVAVGLIDESTIVEIFAEGDGSGWTIVLTRSSGQSCIAAAGSTWMQITAAIAGPSA